MCGIFGIFDREGAPNDDAVLTAMGSTITHRGPDDVGIFSAPGVAVGNRRLSIIDIEGGHQPFLSDDGRLALVQNGEIYNHIELARELVLAGAELRTHSDTEVLLRLWEREGARCLSRLNGMFAIAIAEPDSIVLVRDRIGVKPLYYYDDGRRIYFASEIKALLKAGVPAEIDPVAIHHLLTFNYVPPPLTIVRGVKHLMPGCFARLDREGVRITPWWQLKEQVQGPQSDTAWTAQFLDLLDDAVRLRLRADVPFGAFLSGGIDSSTVVGLMARHVDRPVRTFSIGFNSPRFDESRYAAMAAERFGTRHVSRIVDDEMIDLWPLATYHCDQPHGDVSFLPTYKVSQLAAEHVKVVLTGDGGDELFAGYKKYADFSVEASANQPESVFHQEYFNHISVFDEAQKRAVYTQSFSSLVGGLDSFDLARPLLDEVPHWDRINRMLYLDVMMLLPGNNLVKPDRMGMAVSLEARTPFLDYRMVEFAFQTPGDRKLRNGETKANYKRAVESLIGSELTYREKQMFTVPIGDWLRQKAGTWAEDFLLNPLALSRGIFEPSAVRSMLDRHRSGESNFTREIRLLIAIELWCRIFADNDGAEIPTFAGILTTASL